MKFILEFIMENYISLVVLVALVMFMIFSTATGTKNIVPFKIGIGVIVLCAIFEFADAKLALIEDTTLPYLKTVINWRYFTSLMGYLLRPILPLMLIIQLDRNKKHLIFFLIPSFINLILLLINLKVHWYYGFNEMNWFVRGKLFYYNVVLCAFYVICILYNLLKCIKSRTKSETIILFFLVFVVALAVLFEILDLKRSLLIPSVSVSYMIYYLYLIIMKSKRDELTGLLNRRSFYEDVQKRTNDITACISIDMNNLKLINDNYGHLEGDKALLDLANIILSLNFRGLKGYRIGGDEFIIICYNRKEEDIDVIVKRLNYLVKKTNFTVAIGVSYYNESDSIDSLLRIADQRMYERKSQMKRESID